ncbi:MAG TPA: hypothetical protein IAA75_03495 [Candidatus Pullichristensenella avicola]|nr:hypothetical protein [Candidatus Pullichristensenella avicola]
MRYDSDEMERQAILAAAARMCAAARTAPKAKGADNILTMVLTGEDKKDLTDKMREIAATGNPAVQFFNRDADNVDAAQAIVLIGAKPARAGLKVCGFCGFDSCASADAAGARCAFNMIDLGIAVGSAASVAADCRVDSRVLYSAGKAAQLMEYEEFDVIWLGVPIAAYGKSPFFDRKAQK